MNYKLKLFKMVALSIIILAGALTTPVTTIAGGEKCPCYTTKQIWHAVFKAQSYWCIIPEFYNPIIAIDWGLKLSDYNLTRAFGVNIDIDQEYCMRASFPPLPPLPRYN